MKNCTCFLCGETLTAPIVYNGNTYGWTCITKVLPNAKKTDFKGYVIGENIRSNVTSKNMYVTLEGIEIPFNPSYMILTETNILIDSKEVKKLIIITQDCSGKREIKFEHFATLIKNGSGLKVKGLKRN